MRRVIKEMYDLLLEQKTALENLLVLSQEKRRIIIKGEAEKLDAIVRKELREISKINAIEKKRIALLPDISAELGLPVENMTVGAIAECAGEDEREPLSCLQKELANLLRTQAEINTENQELIKVHIEYSDAMLELMVDSDDPLNNFYGGDGREAQDRKKSTGFFDGQI